MAIPLVTHLVSILGVRPQALNDPDADGYDSVDAPNLVTLVTNWPASITSPTSLRESNGAEDTTFEVDEYAFRCDSTDVNRFDYVIDDVTGDAYQITAIAPSLPVLFGLEHITGRVKKIKGLPHA